MSTENDWLPRPRALALIAATAIFFYFCYQLALPFLPAITWAAALAIVIHPLQGRIAGQVKRPTVAAGLTVAITGLVIVAPGLLVAGRLVTQASQVVEAVKAQTQSGEWERRVESNPRLARVVHWIGPKVDVRSVVERSANAIGSFVYAFLGGSVWVLAQILVTFFTLFYLLRDRPRVVKKVRSLVPLPEAEVDKLFSRVSDTIHATLYGSFVVAVVQGSLGGLIFLVLGLPAPLFWGMVMTLMALIPVLGAPVVWIPAAIYLAVTGHIVEAMILAAWGMTAIGLIDNLLYPLLVGDKMRLHTPVVFFAVVGGVMLFGISGIILGPVAVVVTDTLIEAWQQSGSGNYSSSA